MKKIGVLGNIFVAVVTVIGGGASGVALSLAARAQVSDPPGGSEYGNPDGEFDQRPYCVYFIDRRSHDCEGLRNRQFLCAPCIQAADCPEYADDERDYNAIAGDPDADPPCVVNAIGGGGDCDTCPTGDGHQGPIAPLPRPPQ